MTSEAIRELVGHHVAQARSASGGTDPRRISVEMNAGDIAEAVAVLVGGGRARFVTIVAVDKGLDIELLYNFSFGRAIVTLRTGVAKEASSIATIAPVVPGAAFVEKEISELFGVEFVGHERRTNLVLPDDWPTSKRPLRKPFVGDIFPQARASVENLLSAGTSIRVGPSSAVKREKAGLPRTPPLASAKDDRLHEFKTLLERTGFEKRAGFDARKGKLRYK